MNTNALMAKQVAPRRTPHSAFLLLPPSSLLTPHSAFRTPSTPHSALRTPHSLAFTLIEMIVVTAIIALLAALIFPVAGAVKRSRDLARARTALQVVAHAIDGYKEALGHYPPDNAVATDSLRLQHSPLYYELCGSTNAMSKGVVTVFQPLDGTPGLSVSDVGTAFGTGGFINSARPAAAGEEQQRAKRFLAELKAGQYLDMTVNGIKNCRLLGCPFDGVNKETDSNGRPFCPWWYNSSGPTNNPSSYDLWVDIQVGNKLYRISNWNTKPQILN